MVSVPLINWKQEPLSPISNDEASWLSEDNFYQTIDDNIKFEADLDLCETKAQIATQILESLDNLLDLDDLIKEESYNIFDEKILPILGDVTQHTASQYPLDGSSINKPLYPPRTPDTQLLLNEFENVCHLIGFGDGTTPSTTPTTTTTTTTTLTPPQSPPDHPPIFAQLETITHQQTQSIVYEDLPANQSSPRYVDDGDYEFQQSDVRRELAVVEELVRSRVEDMQCENVAPPSPNSSGASNWGDSSSDDPEWMPEAAEDDDDGVIKSRKRTKPYSRLINVDKKSRKKEQNKNAATRYRMKKKAEVETILSEEKGLMQHHDDLNTKITDLQREIKYLKGLMRDLFKAKGLIN